MKNLIFSILLFATIYTGISSPARAEEAEGGAKEVKAEEGKETKTEGSKATSQQEVSDLQNRLTGLKTKIQSKRDNLKKMVEEKQNIKNDKLAVAKVNEMKVEYKELQGYVKEYDEQLAMLNYRYPEKGLNKERQYERIEIKSLDEMESEFSLEGKIKKTMARVRQQFPNKENPSKNKNDSNPETASKLPEKKDPSRTSVTDPLILSK
jgi:hypothetical protein